MPAIDKAAQEPRFLGNVGFGGICIKHRLGLGFQPLVETFIGLGGTFAFVIELGVSHFAVHDRPVPERASGFKHPRRNGEESNARKRRVRHK
jgi:hypothetical protein